MEDINLTANTDPDSSYNRSAEEPVQDLRDPGKKQISENKTPKRKSERLKASDRLPAPQPDVHEPPGQILQEDKLKPRNANNLQNMADNLPPSSNGGSQPSDGGSQPSNGGSQPSDGGSQSSNGDPQPSDGLSEPSNGSSRSSNGGSQPSNEGSQPSNEGSQPSNGGSLPSNECSLSSNGGSRSSDGGSRSSDGLSQSSNESRRNPDENKDQNNSPSAPASGDLAQPVALRDSANDKKSLKTLLLYSSGRGQYSENRGLFKYNDSISFILDKTGSIINYQLSADCDFYYNRYERRIAENLIREVKQSLSLFKNVSPILPEEYLLILRSFRKAVPNDFETLPSLAKLANVFILSAFLGKFTYIDLKKSLGYSGQTLYRTTAYLKSRGWIKLHNTFAEKYFFLTDEGRKLLTDTLSE